MKNLTNPKTNKGFLLLLTAILFSGTLFAQTMTMAPYKWILNANGAAEDVLAIYSGSMPSGGHILDHQVSLSVNGFLVSIASEFEYCYVDNNYIAHFDKDQLFSNPVVQSFAGYEVTATIGGVYTLGFPDGSTMTMSVPSYTDAVEIFKPGKKK